MLTFDAHLDLAMNALEWNRDLSRPIEEIRQREFGLTDKPDRGRGTVSFGEMRRGGVGICVATQIARYVRPSNPLPGWHSPEQAWAQTQGQLAWYRAMEEAGELAQIATADGLGKHVRRWETWLSLGESSSGESRSSPPPLGYVLSLEGADSILTMHHLERSYAQGLRALGPAHYGPGTYAPGTDATGGIGIKGRELLKEMERLRMILDVSHLCDESFWEAMAVFNGTIWASHSNCRALVPHNRQFSDEQIEALIARDAVIGTAFDGWMLVTGWIRGRTTPESAGLKLEHCVQHIDHICQIAGSARHCGLGTDLDGAFGREQCPTDVATIGDLTKLPVLLESRGYSDTDVQQIMHGNFLRCLTKAWNS